MHIPYGLWLLSLVPSFEVKHRQYSANCNVTWPKTNARCTTGAVAKPSVFEETFYLSLLTKN